MKSFLEFVTEAVSEDDIRDVYDYQLDYDKVSGPFKLDGHKAIVLANYSTQESGVSVMLDSGDSYYVDLKGKDKVMVAFTKAVAFAKAGVGKNYKEAGLKKS